MSRRKRSIFKESRKNHVPEVLEFGPFDEELKDIDI